MTVKRSDVVVATAGRDKNKFFFVVDEDESFVYLANGRERKIENPKRKKIKHLQLVNTKDCRAAEKLRCGERPTNSELRKALASVTPASDGESGGM